MQDRQLGIGHPMLPTVQVRQLVRAQLGQRVGQHRPANPGRLTPHHHKERTQTGNIED